MLAKPPCDNQMNLATLIHKEMFLLHTMIKPTQTSFFQKKLPQTISSISINKKHVLSI